MARRPKTSRQEAIKDSLHSMVHQLRSALRHAELLQDLMTQPPDFNTEAAVLDAWRGSGDNGRAANVMRKIGAEVMLRAIIAGDKFTIGSGEGIGPVTLEAMMSEQSRKVAADILRRKEAFEQAIKATIN